MIPASPDPFSNDKGVGININSQIPITRTMNVNITWNMLLTLFPIQIIRLLAKLFGIGNFSSKQDKAKAIGSEFCKKSIIAKNTNPHSKLFQLE